LIDSIRNTRGGIIGNANGDPRAAHDYKIGMSNVKRLAVSHINAERLEGTYQN
jgi:hypothetical protein